MTNRKDVLVVTTPSIDGVKIKSYIKPVSAHIVAGTNLFSDFLGSLTDVFGGRSQTYQKQLTSLYNEAIERVKQAALQLGANCVVGLKIDMDEISGKNKSMFMISAVGTAVILDKQLDNKPVIPESDETLDNVGMEKINVLRKKKEIIEKAERGDLKFNDDVWSFITAYQVKEVLPHLLKKYRDVITNEPSFPGSTEKFHNSFVGYIEALPDEIKLDFLYTGVAEQDGQIALKLSEIIKELHLFDFERNLKLLKNEDFVVQKRGICIATYDKPSYNKKDVQNLHDLRNLIQLTFKERGIHAVKKTFLSSKEKEIWNCECGRVNDTDTFCNGCGRDIFGFKQHELDARTADDYIRQKIDLITEYLG